VVRRRALVVATVVLLVAAGTGWAEGVRRAPAERAELTACRSAGDAAASEAEQRLSATASYVTPALGSESPDLRRSMLGLISEEAATRLPPVEAALRRCRDVRVWPTNRQRVQARDAYVAFLAAQADRLRAVAENGATVFEGYDEVRRLEAEAAAAFEE
jgi:hypothetical protein